jgi:hypothetical protein
MNMPIGPYILHYCRRRGISILRLASQLGMKRESLYQALRSADMKLSRLRAISQILNHNFFEDYYPSSENPGDTPPPLLSENLQLKQKISLLETELSTLRNFLNLLQSKSEK